MSVQSLFVSVAFPATISSLVYILRKRKLSRKNRRILRGILILLSGFYIYSKRAYLISLIKLISNKLKKNNVSSDLPAIPNNSKLIKYKILFILSLVPLVVITGFFFKIEILNLIDFFRYRNDPEYFEILRDSRNPNLTPDQVIEHKIRLFQWLDGNAIRIAHLENTKID